MKRLFLLLLALVVILILGAIALAACESDWCLLTETQRVQAVDSFEDCARLGFPVMESYPRQCRAGDKHFTEEVNGLPDNGAERAPIGITEPTANAEISSPVTIRGDANVFENNVLIRIVDDTGNTLAATFTTALGDTGEFGVYEAEVPFLPSTTTTGRIEVFSESAQDGSTEHLVTVPVRFETTGTGVFLLD